ncbi:MAG: hemolysin family protein [Muribaculaceae bacterium]|nr:hemolysin family protein [Muribaculaceae bacterium]MDE6510094.1 hemolysin family protein [Muribaculaceae bacterium]
MEASWLAIALVSLLLSAMFSGVEIAFVSADRVRAELDTHKGGVTSRIIDRYFSRPDFFISTLLVGNNIVLVFYGMAGAALLDPWLQSFCGSDALSLLLQTLITTMIIIVTGEFFPKTLFRINPNTSLRVSAMPMYLFYLLLYPLSSFTTWLSRSLMKVAGIRRGDNDSDSSLSVVDLNAYIERTIDQQTLAESQGAEIENEVKIFHNAIDFSTIHLRDCMIPRNEIVAVNIDSTDRRQLSDLFTSSGRSKIIVYKGDIDSVLGYIHVSELLHPGADWTENLKPVLFAPESLLANKMMRRLLAEKRSVAVVIDEFGGTSGMVTLEDLVEEILGDIQDEHDRSDVVARRLPDGSFEFSGRVEVELLRDQFHLDIPESDDYQTLAGYILFATGTIPAQGDTVTLGQLSFTILRSSATKLELIAVAPVDTPE